MTMGAIPIIPIILLIWLGLVSGCKVNMFFKSLKNVLKSYRKFKERKMQFKSYRLTFTNAMK